MHLQMIHECNIPQNEDPTVKITPKSTIELWQPASRTTLFNRYFTGKIVGFSSGRKTTTDRLIHDVYVAMGDAVFRVGVYSELFNSSEVKPFIQKESIWKFERFGCKEFYHSKCWTPTALNERIEFVAVTKGDHPSLMKRISEGVSIRSITFSCACYPPFNRGFRGIDEDSREILKDCLIIFVKNYIRGVHGIILQPPETILNEGDSLDKVIKVVLVIGTEDGAKGYLVVDRREDDVYMEMEDANFLANLQPGMEIVGSNGASSRYDGARAITIKNPKAVDVIIEENGVLGMPPQANYNFVALDIGPTLPKRRKSDLA
ncbi:hypothetical protein WR25_13197 [Diploscapter pachys]|uniref:Uncharacterized protein n=1 Tax=Diploscapter pachys TaxID=2018661 RepID=A0A2A2KYH1_9BILA|nr:hypothetical protein WR25_13197 [Diploscapter pachys]